MPCFRRRLWAALVRRAGAGAAPLKRMINGALSPTISLIAIAVPIVARLMSSPLATVAMNGETYR